jgi:ATP-dependent RNA helicase DHX57
LELSGYVPPKVKNSEKGDGSMACLIKRLDPKRVDYDLIACLVKSVVEEREAVRDGGSVLVFLPGLEEISKTKRAISKICVALSSQLTVLELHGGMKSHEQARVFQNYASSTKIVLSTNVAQTSITIDDCTVVIDTCLEKQSGYDPYNRTPTLTTQVCSKDALKQRRGRAGRVRKGICYKLITRKLYENLMEHGKPEIEVRFRV